MSRIRTARQASQIRLGVVWAGRDCRRIQAGGKPMGVSPWWPKLTQRSYWRAMRNYAHRLTRDLYRELGRQIAEWVNR